MKFNTVLVPPKNIAQAAIVFAQAHYAHDHDDYCLESDGHLPHITLVQTEILDEEKIEILSNKINEMAELFLNDIRLENYYHHLDRGYCGVSVSLSEGLKKSHGHVVEAHSELGLEILSGHGEDYWPHMTFAKTSCELPQDVKIPELLQGQSKSWSLEFGRMGEQGVYLGKYKSS